MKKSVFKKERDDGKGSVRTSNINIGYLFLMEERSDRVMGNLEGVYISLGMSSERQIYTHTQTHAYPPWTWVGGNKETLGYSE